MKERKIMEKRKKEDDDESVKTISVLPPVKQNGI